MNYFWKHAKSVEHSISRAGRVLLLLDFDGTLSPIVSTPARAKLPKATKDILLKLVKVDKICLGIISGRRLDDVKKKVDIKNIIYSGNHGMEWEINGQSLKTFVPVETCKTLRAAGTELESLGRQFPGFLVEDKIFSVAFHYRCVREKDKTGVEKFLDGVLSKYLMANNVSLIKGNETYDLRANLGWTKGSITAELKRKLRAGNGVVIYVGDSATDEDAFRKLKDSVTIKVGELKCSKARYYLNDTKDVRLFLSWLKRVLYDRTKHTFLLRPPVVS